MAILLFIYSDKYLKRLIWWKSLLYLKLFLNDSVFLLFKIYAFEQKLGIKNISFLDCS